MLKRFLITLLALLIAVPANAVDVTPGKGGSACSNLTGQEVYHDLSSASLTLVVGDLGKKHVLYSSTDGKKVTFPSANATGMATGKGAQFCVLSKSRAIKGVNAGTAGTDAILEFFALPGAGFACFANSISSAVGDWRCEGRGLYNGAVPVTLPYSADAGFDVGSVALVASMFNKGSFGGEMIARLSSTLYTAVYVPLAGTSVGQVAMTYNHSTDAWTWGTGVTVYTSANQWSGPRIVAQDTTHYSVMAYEGTTGKLNARSGSISGTAITQGTAISSGAWGVNPADTAAGSSYFLVVDSSTSFFYLGSYDNLHLDITHFSLSGNNVSQDGGAAFASSSYNGTQATGSSSAANVLDIGISSDNATNGVSRYTYATGSVTNTWNRRDRSAASTQKSLQLVDATNRVYYANAGTNTVTRLVLNAGGTDFTEQENFLGPIFSSGTTSPSVALDSIYYLSDDEGLCYNASTTGALVFFGLADIKAARSRATAVAATDSTKIPTPQMGWGPLVADGSTDIWGMDVNTTIRRLAILYTFRDQTLAKHRIIRGMMFDLPRNYDTIAQ